MFTSASEFHQWAVSAAEREGRSFWRTFLGRLSAGLSFLRHALDHRPAPYPAPLPALPCPCPFPLPFPWLDIPLLVWFCLVEIIYLFLFLFFCLVLLSILLQFILRLFFVVFLCSLSPWHLSPLFHLSVFLSFHFILSCFTFRSVVNHPSFLPFFLTFSGALISLILFPVLLGLS